MQAIDNVDFKETSPGVVSVDILAGLLGLTVRRVQQLAVDGVVKKNSERGEYLLAGSVRGYIDFLQRDGVIDGALAAEKMAEEIENLKLKNKKLQRDNDVSDNVLISEIDSREQMSLVARTGIDVLDTLPDVLEMAGISMEHVEIVENKIRQVRAAWSEKLLGEF